MQLAVTNLVASLRACLAPLARLASLAAGACGGGASAGQESIYIYIYIYTYIYMVVSILYLSHIIEQKLLHAKKGRGLLMNNISNELIN